MWCSTISWKAFDVGGHHAQRPLDTRWQTLLTLTEEQFLEHNQHPGGGVLKSDRAALKLSGILKDGACFSVTLTQDQVSNGDLSRFAKDFYTAYRAESESS